MFLICVCCKTRLIYLARASFQCRWRAHQHHQYNINLRSETATVDQLILLKVEKFAIPFGELKVCCFCMKCIILLNYGASSPNSFSFFSEKSYFRSLWDWNIDKTKINFRNGQRQDWLAIVKNIAVFDIFNLYFLFSPWHWTYQIVVIINLHRPENIDESGYPVCLTRHLFFDPTSYDNKVKS